MRFNKTIKTLLVCSAIFAGAITLSSCQSYGNNTSGENDNQKYKVTYENSTIYSIDGINQDGYKKGDKVEFSVTLEDETYEITKVLLENEILNLNGSTYSFEMPAKNVNIYIETSKIGESINKISASKFTYEDINSASYDPITPAKGNVNILVVPVQFKDLSAYTKEELNYIDLAFNGDSNALTWESNKSFYQKSSLNQLNFNFEICDTFIPQGSAASFVANEDDYGTSSQNLLSEIYKKGLKRNGTAINFNDPKYDSNKDTYIDGVWLIYNERSYDKVYGQGDFWAYCTNYYDEQGIFSETDNMYGKYANCAFTFLTEDGMPLKNQNQLDAHTLIHETGHMLGFDDYYDYGSQTNQYSFTGSLDMMDANIGDHNAFNKYSLGWTKANIINESTNITLKPFATSGESIILPSNSFNGSAFSEYLIIEYYTPEGLFEYDSSHNYAGTYPKFFTEKGLRIYHVDARLAPLTVKYRGSSYSYTWGEYLSKNITSLPEYKENSSGTEATFTSIAHANTLGNTSLNKDDKPLIELVSSSNTKLYGKREASNKDLFKTNGNDGYAFSASNQSKFFNNNKFNDGTSLNYKIKINNLDENGASISIECE